MNSFEWFLLLLLIASFVVGPTIGYIAGQAAERAAWHRRYRRLDEKYVVRRPE